MLRIERPRKVCCHDQEIDMDHPIPQTNNCHTSLQTSITVGITLLAAYSLSCKTLWVARSLWGSKQGLARRLPKPMAGFHLLRTHLPLNHYPKAECQPLIATQYLL